MSAHGAKLTSLQVDGFNKSMRMYHRTLFPDGVLLEHFASLFPKSPGSLNLFVIVESDRTHISNMFTAEELVDQQTVGHMTIAAVPTDPLLDPYAHWEV